MTLPNLVHWLGCHPNWIITTSSSKVGLFSSNSVLGSRSTWMLSSGSTSCFISMLKHWKVSGYGIVVSI